MAKKKSARTTKASPAKPSSLAQAKSQKPKANRQKRTANSDLRTYTIRDYRLEKPSFTLRQVRVGDEVRYEVESGDLSAPAPPIRESKHLTRASASKSIDRKSVV